MLKLFIRTLNIQRKTKRYEKKHVCALLTQTFSFSNQIKKNPSHAFNPNDNAEQNSKHLIEQVHKGQTTMQKQYEQVEVTSFQGRSFSNLTQLQRRIITENKFNLDHPQIKPKLASINSLPGIERYQNVSEIQLGNIKVKARNEVFLSEIDPHNIPEDYEIRFDEQKKLTLIGKKIEKNMNYNGQDKTYIQAGGTTSSEMRISQAQSFEQKSLGQLSQKYMGQIGYKYQFNRKKSFKEFLLAIPFIILLIDPIASTLDELYETLKSIEQIQEQQMKEVTKIKRQNMVHALLNNKDFNRMI